MIASHAFCRLRAIRACGSPSTLRRLVIGPNIRTQVHCLSSSTPTRSEDSNSLPDTISYGVSDFGSPENSADSAVETFSYHPFDLVCEAIDAIHIHGGLPYWISIIALTVGVRTLLLPITVKIKRDATRALPLNADIQLLKARGDKEGLSQSEIGVEMAALMKKHKTTPLNPLLSPLLQFPVLLSMYFGLNRMPDHCPDYVSGGTLWFTDLSVPDSTAALGLLNAGVMYFTINNAFKSVPPPKSDFEGYMRRMMTNFLPLIMIPIALNMPSGVVVYFITSNCYTHLVQRPLLESTWVKNTFLTLAPGVSPVQDPNSNTNTVSSSEPPKNIAGVSSTPSPPPAEKAPGMTMTHREMVAAANAAVEKRRLLKQQKKAEAASKANQSKNSSRNSD